MPNSEIYFNAPSPVAKRLLYYPVAVGKFYCNKDYCVNRKNFDSFLALYVYNGEITLEQNKITTTIQQGELLLLDCYLPHKYYTKSQAKTIWIHFDGSESRKWFEEIVAIKGQKFQIYEPLISTLEKIKDCVRDRKEENEISLCIYTLLSDLIYKSEKDSSIKQLAVKTAEEYMLKNFNQPLTVADIAKQTHFSSPYFNKLFREIRGVSPYDYLLRIRLEKAKELLFYTELPISAIAERTGFNSTSNFLYFFKKKTGFSALKFRKLRF